MDDVFRFADALGPLKILHVHEPSIGLKAILVVDNLARGTALGGMRLAEDVSLEECFRLARAMTFKNAAADLPHGGGKMVIYGDPRMPEERKELLLRGLAQALKNETTYIFAPDMGTDETAMSWIHDEVDRVVGLPRELGGIPLDEIGATGWGLKHATQVAADFLNMKLNGARIVVQGFGAVGQHAARFLEESGCALVGVSDSKGGVSEAQGIDVQQLIDIKANGGSVVDYVAGHKGAKVIKGDELIGVDCDIWIPAARPDVINISNVQRLKAPLMVQGANIPVSPEAEKILRERKTLVVPDFIANAGGVICAAMEYQGLGEGAVMSAIEDKIRRNTTEVLEQANQAGSLPRDAAVQLARSRVEKAMAHKRFSLFSSSSKVR